MKLYPSPHFESPIRVRIDGVSFEGGSFVIENGASVYLNGTLSSSSGFQVHVKEQASFVITPTGSFSAAGHTTVGSKSALHTEVPALLLQSFPMRLQALALGPGIPDVNGRSHPQHRLLLRSPLPSGQQLLLLPILRL